MSFVHIHTSQPTPGHGTTHQVILFVFFSCLFPIAAEGRRWCIGNAETIGAQRFPFGCDQNRGRRRQEAVTQHTDGQKESAERSTHTDTIQKCTRRIPENPRPNLCAVKSEWPRRRHHRNHEQRAATGQHHGLGVRHRLKCFDAEREERTRRCRHGKYHQSKAFIV